MIIYLDTSALVKLYVRERGSVIVRRALHEADLVATSRVAYPESRAAFARRQREGALSPRALRRAVTRLDGDLPSYVVVELTPPVAARAGRLAEARALRGFDAVHLASAVELAAMLGETPQFLAFDRRLADAAEAEGLRRMAP